MITMIPFYVATKIPKPKKLINHFPLVALTRVGQKERRQMKLLTTQEVCKIIGSTDPKGRKVRELRKQGVLEGARFGRRLMFTESSVNRYVRSVFREQN